MPKRKRPKDEILMIFSYFLNIFNTQIVSFSFLNFHFLFPPLFFLFASVDKIAAQKSNTCQDHTDNREKGEGSSEEVDISCETDKDSDVAKWHHEGGRFDGIC